MPPLHPITSLRSLAARFHRLKSGHGPTGIYLKRFGHRDEDKCWCCGGTVYQIWEHLFRHCSRWRDHQKELWTGVWMAMGWYVGRWQHVQITELCSIEKCDQAVMDFLVATEVGKFPP